MTPSTETTESFLKDPPTSSYLYDLRLEIGVKDSNDTIPVVAIFRDLIQRMKAAADGNHLVALTATDKLYLEKNDMSSEEFQKAFHVDKVEGKVTKVMLGFKIRSMTKLSEIKSRLMHTYLKPRNLFLRTHAGGFDNGVKSYAYGYLKYDHPDHPDLSALNQRFSRRISEAWKTMDKEDRKKWKTELPNLFFGTTGIMLPLVFTKEKITASSDIKPKIITTGLVVSTPAKYGKFAKTLLDMVILNKKINNLIPFALSKEDPNGYFFMMAEQARFVESHRNIPIQQVPVDANSTPGNQGQTLLEILNANPFVQRVSYDLQQNKYHVSTTATRYKELHQWIERVLQDHKFPFGPEIRPLKYSNATSYTSVFQDAMTVASASYDTNTIMTTPSNPWKNRPPLAISYTPTDEAFPPLPAKPPTPATASTTSETLDEETIHSAISSAIKKMEAQHKADLEQLKSEFQSKLAAVEKQMAELGAQVVTQTYQALVSETSPLATKTEQERLSQDVSTIKIQMNTLIEMIKAQQQPDTKNLDTVSNFPVHTPPKGNATIPKKTRKTTSPVKMRSLDDYFTQDTYGSSAASIPEEDMEGCED